MKKKIHFKCYYNDFHCSKLNTATMTLDEPCDKCEHYNNGVRATGAMPILEWFLNLFKRDS